MRETDEQSSVSHFRAVERYFCENGQWYFSTREGEEGPFRTREAAEAAMQRYVNSIQAAANYKKEQAEKYAQDPEKRVDRTIWNQRYDTI